MFGCDVCQEVCPWNRKAEPGREPAFEARTDFPRLDEIVTIDEAAFRLRFRGTPITRTKRAGLARNAAIVAANRARRS
jgi:epoxyqueuosine reductase